MRKTQNPPGATPCRFESGLRHQGRYNGLAHNLLSHFSFVLAFSMKSLPILTNSFRLKS